MLSHGRRVGSHQSLSIVAIIFGIGALAIIESIGQVLVGVVVQGILG